MTAAHLLRGTPGVLAIVQRWAQLAWFGTLRAGMSIDANG
jgi:hypothetical protein